VNVAAGGGGSSSSQSQQPRASCILRLVDTTFDERAMGMRWKHGLVWQGTAVSSQILVKLLVKKCGFLVVRDSAQQQQQVQQQQQAPTATTETIYELSHQYFCPGRPDLIARIRFGGIGTQQQHQQPNDDHDGAATMQWPSGARAASIHLADERQYPSLLKKHPDKLWPESMDSDDDDDHDDNASLDDDELDATWDREVSDGIDPIQFGTDQLTQVVPSHPATTRPAVRQQLDDDNNDASLRRSRLLLLQSCWERAVHMANTTFTANTNASEPPEEQQQRQPQQQQRQPPSTDKQTIAPQPPRRPPPPARSRSMAEQACRNWNLRPQHEDAATAIDRGKEEEQQVDQLRYMCSVCRNVYASEDQLEEHFYGTWSTTGCCWVGIAYARRRFIRSALSTEVDTQRRLLLLILLEKPTTTSNDDFGVLDRLEEIFRNSQLVTLLPSSSSSSCRPAVTSETLQVSAYLPPLMLNHDVLESARNRIVDRYTTVRR
jgi:hypothetical protein